MSDFTDILDQMQDLHDIKNNDYSSEGEFGNFSESERVGVPGWKGAFIRLQDKYTRACNLIRGKEQMVKDEALEDTLLDLANYAVIVLCLRRSAAEERDAATDIPQHVVFGDEHLPLMTIKKQKKKCQCKDGENI